MYYNEDFLDLNPKDLLFYILHRWKAIIAGSIVLALLLGFFMTYPDYKNSTSPEMIASRQENLQSFEEQLLLYTKKIDVTREKISTLQDYIDSSILMNADHKNVFIAKSSYYVDTHYQIRSDLVYQNPNMTETITWYYKNYLGDYSIYTSLSQQMSIEEKYLMELVTVNTDSTNTFSISVIHPEKATAEAILEHLDHMLFQYQDTVSSVVDEHTLTQMLHTCGNYISQPLAELQTVEATRMLTLQDELSLQKKELTQFQKNNTPAVVNVLSEFVKWFIIGGLAGGVVLVVLFFFIGIFDNHAYAPDDVASRYNIVLLGSVLPYGQKFDHFTAWLRRQECLINENSQENYDFLAANIQNHCNNTRELLICSDADTQTNNALISALEKQLPEIHFHTAGSLFSDASALKLLAACDSVLLIISKEQTRRKHILKSLAQIRDCAKDVLGFIYVG